MALMNPLKSEQLNYPIHTIVLQSVDYFLKYGKGMNILQRKESIYENINYVDIERATFLRFMVSSFGYIETAIGNEVYERLERKQEDTSYITLRTKHPATIRQNATRKKRIVNALVYMRIPIIGYFDGEELIS